MADIKIAFYVVKKGYGYWQPTKEMREIGFVSVPCGEDGPEAWARSCGLLGFPRVRKSDSRLLLGRRRSWVFSIDLF